MVLRTLQNYFCSTLVSFIFSWLWFFYSSVVIVSLNFETRPVAGRPPSARGYHAALQADSRVFIFGGFNGNEVFDDVHLMDLAAAAYLPQVTSFKIDVD